MTDLDLDPGARPPAAQGPPPSCPPGGYWRGRWVYLALITLVVVAGDQATKHWAQHDLQPVRQIRVVEGYARLNLTYVRNPGAAWGFLARADESFRRPFFLVISLVAMSFILFLFLRLQRGQLLLMVALSLVLGGAVGNFIDRMRYNYVVDFIDCRLGGFKWPTFNVADIAITVGVIFLFAEMFLLPWLRQRRAAPGAPEAPEAPTHAAAPGDGRGGIRPEARPEVRPGVRPDDPGDPG